MLKSLLITLLLFSTSALSAPNVVVSIAPIQSLVSNITQGVTTPKLLLNSDQSAHHAHLKPSQLSLVHQADLIVTIHPKMEQGLTKLLSTINTKNKLYVIQLKQSEEKDSMKHHDEHDDKANYHNWLSIPHMKDFSQRLSTKLSEIDPKNKLAYQENLVSLTKRLNILEQSIKKQLLLYKGINIATYSNAFEYFINSNKLTQATLITAQHEERLSIYKIIKAKKSMQDSHVKCLLSTTEVPLKRINTLTEGLDINTARINIIGSEFDTGSDQYFQLMNNITSRVNQCLQ